MKQKPEAGTPAAAPLPSSLPSGGGSFVRQPDGTWLKVEGTAPPPAPHERKKGA